MQVLHLALKRQSFTLKLKNCGEKAAENAHAEEFTALKRYVSSEAHVKLWC